MFCKRKFTYVKEAVALRQRTSKQKQRMKGFSSFTSRSRSQRYSPLQQVARRTFFAVSSAFLQSWALKFPRPWMCVKEDCRNVNKAITQECETCGGPKPQLAGWVCTSCETRNHKGVKYCRKCAASPNPTLWSCMFCLKNNKIDEIDDNSICGHCGYDMAPLSRTEEEILEQAKERQLQREQEAFDSISPREAENHFGSEVGDVDPANPPEWSVPKKKVIRPIKPFQPTPAPVAKSVIGRKQRVTTPAVPSGPPGFDWFCREAKCGSVNGGDDECCQSCGVKIAPDEWECLNCAAKNHWSRSACFSCATKIPVSWKCESCQAMTSIYDTSCRSCAAPRPPTVPRSVADIRRNGNSQALSGVRAKKSDWSCPSCNILNFASRTRCFKCDAEKPEGASSSSVDGAQWDASGKSPARGPGEGNWHCAQCGASNFRTRVDCWQCSKAASSTVTRFANDDNVPTFEKEGFQSGQVDLPVAPGQLKQWGSGVGNDDWTCSKCFSKNFKNKTECHKCGAVKSILTAPRKAFTKKPVKI